MSSRWPGEAQKEARSARRGRVWESVRSHAREMGRASIKRRPRPARGKTMGAHYLPHGTMRNGSAPSPRRCCRRPIRRPCAISPAARRAVRRAVRPRARSRVVHVSWRLRVGQRVAASGAHCEPLDEAMPWRPPGMRERRAGWRAQADMQEHVCRLGLHAAPAIRPRGRRQDRYCPNCLGSRSG